jgi:protein phosphatase
VDLFTLTLQKGDQMILCSDGLWEMVPDSEIRRIVEKARTPQQACDALIEAANRAGGEDNIAVIVVKME